MSLIIELEKTRTVGMMLFEVDVVGLWFSRRVAALFAHVHLGAPLLVGVVVLHSVHLQAVALEGTPLSERLLAQIALVRPDTCMSSCVPFEIKCVIESFAAEAAKVSFEVRMTLHVPVQESLQGKNFGANSA